MVFSSGDIAIAVMPDGGFLPLASLDNGVDKGNGKWATVHGGVVNSRVKDC